MTELRRYGQWAGEPQGRLEDTTRCITEVWPSGRGAIAHQCRRQRGFGPDGLYCAIHNPERVNAKAQKQHEKYLAESRKRHIEWLGPALLAMLEKILADLDTCCVIDPNSQLPRITTCIQHIAEAKALIAEAKGEKGDTN